MSRSALAKRNRHTTGNHHIVCGVSIDRLIERERNGVAIQRPIQVRVEDRERGLRETRDELLYVADAASSGIRTTWTLAVPEGEI